MSSGQDLLANAVGRIFTNFCSPDRVDLGWDPELWQVLEDNGMTLLSTDQVDGSPGGDLRDVAVVLRAAGARSAPVPLAEKILGGLLLAQFGIAIPTGPLAVCVSTEVKCEPTHLGWRLTGGIPRVPWARCAHSIIIIGHCDGAEYLAQLEPSAVSLRPGRNLAEEPRDDVTVDDLVLSDRFMQVPDGTVKWTRLYGALFRSLLMSGAAERALELTVAHTLERNQFGRPIAQLQAVQQQVAELAGEVAALRIASDAAIDVCAQTEDIGERIMAIGSAKGQAGRTAGVVTRVAHQMHGAIGLTREHQLRLSTTRLWSWRDEWGNEGEWWSEVGSLLLESKQGPWPNLARII
jgi:acyl-CoA dehydrogenase